MKFYYWFSYFIFILSFIASAIRYVKENINNNDIGSDIAFASVLICYLAIVLIGDKLNKKQ